MISPIQVCSRTVPMPITNAKPADNLYNAGLSEIGSLEDGQHRLSNSQRRLGSSVEELNGVLSKVTSKDGDFMRGVGDAEKRVGMLQQEQEGVTVIIARIGADAQAGHGGVLNSAAVIAAIPDIIERTPIATDPIQAIKKTLMKALKVCQCSYLSVCVTAAGASVGVGVGMAVSSSIGVPVAAGGSVGAVGGMFAAIALAWCCIRLNSRS